MNTTAKSDIETHRLSDTDAEQLEREAGYLVVRLAPTRGDFRWAKTEQDAHDLAAKLSNVTGALYAVFKPARLYHMEP